MMAADAPGMRGIRSRNQESRLRDTCCHMAVYGRSLLTGLPLVSGDRIALVALRLIEGDRQRKPCGRGDQRSHDPRPDATAPLGIAVVPGEARGRACVGDSGEDPVRSPIGLRYRITDGGVLQKT
jgi:hypothetical protein